MGEVNISKDNYEQIPVTQACCRDFLWKRVTIDKAFIFFDVNWREFSQNYLGHYCISFLKNYDSSCIFRWGYLSLQSITDKTAAMASSPDLVQYIADQCSGAGEIVSRKMFGDYGIYCDGKIFGLVCDDNLFIKPTEAGRKMLRSIELRPPYDSAKPYYYIADIDDAEYLSDLVRATCTDLPAPKPKRKKK